MSTAIPSGSWPTFCFYFKEAADENPAYSMPDLAKLGDVGYNLGQALGCVVAAAAAAGSLANQANASRFAEHMLATGNINALIFLVRFCGWKLMSNGQAIAIPLNAIGGMVESTGTQRIALRTLTLGVGGTVAASAVTALTGAFAAGYVGTLIGCFMYAGLRSCGYLDPVTGWAGQACARYYGYDPVKDRGVDEKLRVLRARNAVIRLAGRTGATIPHNILAKY